MSDSVTSPGPSAADPTVVRYVNGVFKGGGAKGIAYAGALTAWSGGSGREGSEPGLAAGDPGCCVLRPR